MIDYHKEIVKTLNSILPTHYEMVLHSGIKTPCISYMELSNTDDITTDTLGYSRITYQVKVWSNDIAELQKYSLMIDKALRPLGFKRVGSAELHDKASALAQKVLNYQALAIENY